jgi:hypothetical protein
MIRLPSRVTSDLSSDLATWRAHCARRARVENAAESKRHSKVSFQTSRRCSRGPFDPDNAEENLAVALLRLPLLIALSRQGRRLF